MIDYDLTGNGDISPSSASFADEDYNPTVHGHYLESDVRVFLRRNSANAGWLIDGATTDGYGLETSYERVEDRECACEFLDEGGTRTPEHVAATDAAEHAGLPDAEELLHLLADALGYTLTKQAS
ncbi:hypothetical protein [Rhodococcoides fascians]|uniref:hypothetical protein n=1 Tax=Rhodococcoides fascians TaxID=1828 RepID=UPI00068A97E1|nr:hypothetical protein [Rhodococcus fascians]